jgi:hypothetical protein
MQQIARVMMEVRVDKFMCMIISTLRRGSAQNVVHTNHSVSKTIVRTRVGSVLRFVLWRRSITSYSAEKSRSDRMITTDIHVCKAHKNMVFDHVDIGLS